MNIFSSSWDTRTCIFRTPHEKVELISSWFHRFFAEVVGELPVLDVSAFAASGPVPVRPRQGPPAVAAECKHHARMTIVDRELYDPVQKTHHSRSHYVSQLNLR